MIDASELNVHTRCCTTKLTQSEQALEIPDVLRVRVEGRIYTWKVFFADHPAPDRNLGRYVMEQTGRDLLLWQGSCIVHETFSEKKIIQLKIQYPEAEVLAHPECEPPVLRHASYIGSTTALLKYCQKSATNTFIVATEPGIIHQMQKEAPYKSFIPAPPMNNNCNCNECPYMRLNTLEKLYQAMKNRNPEITLSEEIRIAALRPLQRMLEMSSVTSLP